jgi:hypothetical protein
MQSDELWSGKNIILLEETTSCTLRIAESLYTFSVFSHVYSHELR